MKVELASKATGVYIIANLTSGNVYVGSAAVSFASRFRNHKSLLRRNKHHCRHLQAAWNKYGEENFVFFPVQATEPKDAVRVEQEWMDQLKPAYNSNPKAGSMLGFQPAPGFREKMIGVSQRIFSDPAVRERMVDGQKRAWADPEIRERRMAAFRESNARPETKESHRLAILARWSDPQKREALRQSQTGKPRPTVRARSKFTSELKQAVIAAISTGEPQRAIALRLGIDQSSVSKINRKAHWTDKNAG